MLKPQINVTPLIDVLLVLLIIFMVVSPLKPSAFKTRVPSETEPSTVPPQPNPDTIIVSIGIDSSLALNNEQNVGTVSEPEVLVARLATVFAERTANGNISRSFAEDPERPVTDRTERTVFIKAPRTMDYGSVARVVDAVKRGGAYPISLQIDRLD